MYNRYVTNHKSHRIFIYLGILVAIFILFFGFNYLKSVYILNEAAVIVSDQGYDTGALTESPFISLKSDVLGIDPSMKKEGNSLNNWISIKLRVTKS